MFPMDFNTARLILLFVFFSDNFLIISAVNHMKLVSGGPIFAHLKSGRVANNLKKFNGDIRTTSW